ncbi:6-phospho-3-hexuloisomerase [Paenibacillus sp. 1P07SE]|uniref:6-phospho-3-hexuloisomerase n=1 Tax=Paenibacillus sp. 1P07SE TaxID=3132209 RepID=UPI0039A5170E
MAAVQAWADRIAGELTALAASIPSESANRLAEALHEASAVFVAGAGRSGLMGKALAMRLMHLGIKAHVVGETATPAFGADDVLLLGSGSGETASLVAMAGKARQLGGTVALVTTNSQSTIAASSDLVIELTASQKDHAGSERLSVQPMGSLFEQGLLLFYDAVILRLMELSGQDGAAMYGSHANLE